MSELAEKIKTSIERLKAFEPEEGYYLAFSGGKDSVVCKALMDMAGVKYDATYRVTSVDRWPKYKESYLRAFQKMLDLRAERHKSDPSRPLWRTEGTDYRHPTAHDVFNWWMMYDILPGQMDLFEEKTDD